MTVVEEGFAFERADPVPLVRTYLEYSWAIKARRCRVAVEAVLPDAHVELFFNFGPAGRCVGDRAPTQPLGTRRAWAVGPHHENMLVAKETADCDILGVRLAPAAAAQLFGAPVSELAGEMVDLDLLWPGSVELMDRLFATERGLRIAAVEEALRARLAPACDQIRRARALARRVAEAGPGSSMGRVAKELGLAHRTMIASLLTHVGLRPKTYHRVTRLRRAMRLLGEGPIALAELALLTGYYDQAHLSNEFRGMTGLTPTQYAARRSWVSDGVVPFRLAENPPPS